LAVASDEQYESILDDKITLLARNFHTLHKFHKERRRSPRCCFECGDTTHFITNCPKWKKLDSFSNKYNYTNWNDSSSKDDDKKKHRMGTRRRRSFRRPCLKRVLPSSTLTSPVMTPLAQRRMRRSRTSKVTSLAFASWASLRETSLTLTLTPT
jgi:hypothetical protein